MDRESGQEADVEEMSERNHDHSTTQGDDESIHADQGTLVSHLKPKDIKMKYLLFCFMLLLYYKVYIQRTEIKL